ncbi:MAG TPA: PadR family transcriptional regulator [Actinopolymorphaceae bacterium]
MGTRALRTPLTMAVLSLLHEEPRHPYQMQTLLRERHVGSTVKLRGGSLYDAVARLEKAGLVRAVETVRPGARPERTVYEITPAGRELMGELVREYLGTVAREFPVFPAGLAHILDVPSAEAADLLRRRVGALRAEFDDVAARLEELRELPRVVLLEVEYTQRLRRTEIEWIESVVRDIETGELAWLDTPSPRDP